MKQKNTNHYESVSANTCCNCANQTFGNPHCVDTNPPSHARLTTTPLNKHVPLNLQHHDQATILAGKLSALLQRDYLKGRDVYDLWWYLNQPNWPEPNLEYLNQCLQQGGWGHDALTPANWRTAVQEQLLPVNWPLVMEDVGSFIINLDEQPGFSKQQLWAVLGYS